MPNMERKYLVLLTVILCAVAAYGLMTLQIVMSGIMMVAILCIVLYLDISKSSSSELREKKQFARFLIALMATLYGFISTQWLLPCFVITLLSVDYIISDLKEWMDARQERYLMALKEMNP